MSSKEANSSGYGEEEFSLKDLKSKHLIAALPIELLMAANPAR
jgi:hypothetical protein